MAELKTNAEWKQWGKDDPLWGVASWASKQKDGASPWTEQEFYALGESDWQDFSKHWEQYGLNRRCCLEIGCGAGRLTKQLATSFESVCAVDVSEDMIKYARQAVQGAHVEFTVIDGLYLPQSDSSVTAVFSTHVLQHLDAEATGLSYFREFFRVLQVGGSLMVHLPLYQFPDVPGNLQAVLAPQYAIYRVVAGLRADTKRRLGLGGS